MRPLAQATFSCGDPAIHLVPRPMELRTAPYLWPIHYVQYLGPSQSRSEPAPTGDGTVVFVGGRAETDGITRKTFALALRSRPR